MNKIKKLPIKDGKREFTCENCGTVFVTDQYKFTKEKELLRVRNEGFFLMERHYGVYQVYYSLKTHCPQCQNITENKDYTKETFERRGYYV